jgi:signal transduction histidine kinase
MPEMDGHALLQQIRSDPNIYHLPVIFVTGYASADDRRRAKELGVEEYLTKPLDSTDLIDSVRNALLRRQATERHINHRIEAIRTQILNLVQHEFRTPLTLIMGYGEYLQEIIDDHGVQAVDEKELRQSLDAILEGSRRLHHLVESFITLAHLGRETLPADDIYPLDPLALWRESVTMLREEINTSPLQIILSEPPDPVIVYGVMELLREALVRLLDNALRYRGPNSQFVWLTVVTKPGFIGWEIRDEGIGIPSNSLAVLAEPFVRLHKPGVTTHGAGLSLTLARRVAELHGGTLTIDSEEGRGSVFTLWVVDRDE